jgi:hypothetical protein
VVKVQQALQVHLDHLLLIQVLLDPQFLDLLDRRELVADQQAHRELLDHLEPLSVHREHRVQ